MLAGQPAAVGGRRQRPVGDQRLIHRAVQHRAQVVGHAAIDRHPGGYVALDGLHRVQGHGRVSDERPAGLEQQPPVGAARQELVRGSDDCIDVLGDIRRPLLARVRDAKSTPQVVDRERAQAGDRLYRSAKRLQLEKL